jgi:hypothetical protein
MNKSNYRYFDFPSPYPLPQVGEEEMNFNLLPQVRGEMALFPLPLAGEGRVRAPYTSFTNFRGI